MEYKTSQKSFWNEHASYLTIKKWNKEHESTTSNPLIHYKQPLNAQSISLSILFKKLLTWKALKHQKT